jgi:hypothetical protein
MLRITRRTGERIMLGDDVIIEVVEVRGGTVRLGRKQGPAADMRAKQRTRRSGSPRKRP